MTCLYVFRRIHGFGRNTFILKWVWSYSPVACKSMGSVIIHGLFICVFVHLFLFCCWGLNQELCACEGHTLPPSCTPSPLLFPFVVMYLSVSVYRFQIFLKCNLSLIFAEPLKEIGWSHCIGKRCTTVVISSGMFGRTGLERPLWCPWDKYLSARLRAFHSQVLSSSSALNWLELAQSRSLGAVGLAPHGEEGSGWSQVQAACLPKNPHSSCQGGWHSSCLVIPFLQLPWRGHCLGFQTPCSQPFEPPVDFLRTSGPMLWF